MNKKLIFFADELKLLNKLNINHLIMEVIMPYKRLLSITILVVLLFSSNICSQEVVLTLLPATADTSTYINWQIIADTTATGGLLSNRVYELQRDEYYAMNRTFTVLTGETMRLRAEEGSGAKPIVYLLDSNIPPNPTRPPGNMFVLNGAHLVMKNICVAGFYEPIPDEVNGVQGGLINTTAVGSSIILDGVIFSNINGQHVRTGNNSTKVEIRNSIFANMGALETSNLGAGKGIDLRESACDTLIFVNNTFVNYQDRPIRHYFIGNPDSTGLIKYGLIDHNTFINGMGFHGLFSLGSVGDEIHITNNLFVDAFALGEDSTDATRTAEWANTGEIYSNGNNRIMWIFSTPNTTTDWTISNNFYSVSTEGQTWLDDDHFGFGPFGRASQLSWHINSRLGADSVNAFVNEDNLALGNIPNLMTNMMTWYENPAGGNRTKNTPAGGTFNWLTDDYDRRVIEYYRDTLDATYPTTAAAYIGSTTGQPVGDLNWFPQFLSVEQLDNVPSSFELLQNYPNPFNPNTTIKFKLEENGFVTLNVYNVLGQKVKTLVSEDLTFGTHQLDFDASALSSGVYFYKLESGKQTSVRKMMLLK
jgi:hypothetical protein